jgi:hypothetical protein
LPDSVLQTDGPGILRQRCAAQCARHNSLAHDGFSRWFAPNRAIRCYRTAQKCAIMRHADAPTGAAWRAAQLSMRAGPSERYLEKN